MKTLEEFTTELAEAITKTLDCDAVSDIVQEMRDCGYDIGNMDLDLTFNRIPCRFSVPFDPSVKWLEKLYSLKDAR